jgi:hypothetical protein
MPDLQRPPEEICQMKRQISHAMAAGAALAATVEQAQPRKDALVALGQFLMQVGHAAVAANLDEVQACRRVTNLFLDQLSPGVMRELRGCAKVGLVAFELVSRHLDGRM